MHPAAYEWVARWATSDPVTVLELGGRDVNGSCRRLFPNAGYTSLDISDGHGVDIVADAASWIPDRLFDIVLSTEVFEHCREWPAICVTAAMACAGRFIVTAAGPGRDVHSGVDGGPTLHDGEWYENIEPARLLSVLDAAGFVDIEVDVAGPDVRAVATKG